MTLYAPHDGANSIKQLSTQSDSIPDEQYRELSFAFVDLAFIYSPDVMPCISHRVFEGSNFSVFPQ